jgi:hypothetical protein
MISKIALFFALIFYVINASAQSVAPGIIGGNLLDEKSAAVAGATVELLPLADTVHLRRSTASGTGGDFSFAGLSFGYYRLRISYVGFKPMIIDSINVREERFDFSLNDLLLKLNVTAELDEVIVYAEKLLYRAGKAILLITRLNRLSAPAPMRAIF